MDPQDPRTKQQIKDLLFDFLYEPLQRRMESRLKALIQTNCLALQADYQGFIYKGAAYVSDSRPQPRKLSRLAPQLHADMETYLNELHTLNRTEIPFVLGFINQVLNASNDLQDYLRVLPDCLHPPIQALIDSCACRTEHLDPLQVADLQRKNQQSIDLIRQRLILNLLE